MRVALLTVTSKSNLLENTRFSPSKFLLELLTSIFSNLVSLYQHYMLFAKEEDGDVSSEDEYSGSENS